MQQVSMPFKTKPKLAVALTVGFSLVLLILPQRVKYSFATAISGLVYAPFSALGNGLAELMAVRKNNQILRKSAIKLELENQALRETALENQRLKNLLGLPSPGGFEPLAAKVIGIESSPRPSEITINRGAKDGIRRNLPVVNLTGLVGKVTDATSGAAVVELLFNPGCRVAARDQRSRVLGIVKWKSGAYLTLDNISSSDDVAVGDTMVSSGLGGLFPEGLLIGTVRSVQTDSLSIFRRIEVFPAVRFAATEEVFVLLPKSEVPARREEK